MLPFSKRPSRARDSVDDLLESQSNGARTGLDRSAHAEHLEDDDSGEQTLLFVPTSRGSASLLPRPAFHRAAPLVAPAPSARHPSARHRTPVTPWQPAAPASYAPYRAAPAPSPSLAPMAFPSSNASGPYSAIAPSPRTSAIARRFGSPVALGALAVAFTVGLAAIIGVTMKAPEATASKAQASNAVAAPHGLEATLAVPGAVPGAVPVVGHASPKPVMAAAAPAPKPVPVVAVPAPKPVLVAAPAAPAPKPVFVAVAKPAPAPVVAPAPVAAPARVGVPAPVPAAREAAEPSTPKASRRAATERPTERPEPSAPDSLLEEARRNTTNTL